MRNFTRRFRIGLIAVISLIASSTTLAAEHDVEANFDKPLPTAIDQSPLVPVANYGQPIASTRNQIPARTSSKTKAISSISDIKGEYVMTYCSLDSTIQDGGCSVSIDVVDGCDSITITNFWHQYVSDPTPSGLVVKACVDLSTMTLTIPNQVVAYNSTYGDIDLSASSTDLTPSRSTQVTGTISADGTISFDTAWGLYVVEGEYADYYYGVYDTTLFELCNATMTCNVKFESSETSKSTETVNFGVIAEQDGDTISVKNFYNVGPVTIKIVALGDSTAKIESQYLYTVTNTTIDMYTFALTYTTDSYGNYDIESYASTIKCDTASNARTISWGPWHALHINSSGLLGSYVVNYPLDGKIETTFDIVYPSSSISLNGDGTADNPYLIATASDWNTLSKYAVDYCDDMKGKYIKLTDDIDFTGIEMLPLGYDGSFSFNGDLDGAGYSISGFDLTATSVHYGAVTLSAGSVANIHDLTINGKVTSSYEYCGGAVGILYGTMTNVVNKGTFASVTGTFSYSGGLIGEVESGATVKNCVNAGIVTVEGLYIGGVAGTVSSGVTFQDCGNTGTVSAIKCDDYSICYVGGVAATIANGTYTGCYNTGVVKTESDTLAYAFGVFANTSYTSSQEDFYIGNCWNSGEVTAGSGVAGVIGTSNSSAVLALVEGCYNTGTVRSTSSNMSYANGGVIQCYNISSTYLNCWNSGTVSSLYTSRTGGVFGGARKTTSLKKTYAVTITGCYNTGTVSADSGSYVGGIVGNIKGYVALDSCYNTGSVSIDGNYIGGISGGVTGTGVTITNCWNSGDITATGYYSGGIVGYNSYTTSIMGGFNVGNISAGAGIAGGIVGYGKSRISYIYNSGSTSAPAFVGGIIGQPYAGITSISRVYSTGKITANTDTCGNIVGVSLSDTDYWDSSNTMSSTYYLSANAVECTDTVSVGLSYAELAKLDLGDDWTAGDNYTYPRLTTLADNDYAKAYAAAVVPADGDSYSSITTDFNVGTPDGVTWTASPDVVAFDGNAATFTETVDGTVTLTATCGDVSVTTEITCDVEGEGINDVMENTLEVVEERFYNLAGAQVAEPEDDARAIYIVVKTYSDGTTETVKEVR